MRNRAEADGPAGARVITQSGAGTFVLFGVACKVAGRCRFHQVLVGAAGDTITAADLDGGILVEHTRWATSAAADG